MARTPPPKIGRPTPIQPVATPVNTFVRPPDPAPSNLHQLAQGMAAFDSGLKGWLQKRDAEQAKADAVRGEAAFNRTNQSGWAAAVSSGEVPANASPVFMESYKQAEGNYKGIKMREAFTQAYTMWEGRNSDDPAVFEQFLSDFISQNIDTDDAGILAGFNPHVEALTEQAYRVHSEERAKTVYNGHVDTRAAIIGDTIDHASIQGVSTGEGTGYDLLLSDIIQQREEALASGIRKEDFDKQMAATIAAKAIEHGDPYLLDLLDQQLPGYDVKFSSLPEYRDLKATTIAALEVEARRQMTERAQLDKAADEAAEDEIVKTIFGQLGEDPLIQIPEDYIAEWEKYDPEARKKLVDARKTFLDGTTLEDPEDLLAVERMIQNGAGPKDILELAADGVITDPNTFRTLLDRAQKRQDAGVDVLGSQTARRFLTTIKERTTPDDIGAMFAPDGLTDEGIEATKDFENMVIDWVIQNPDKSIFEREKFMYEAGELVLKRIDRQDSTAPQYVSPADAQRMLQEEQASQQGLVDGLVDAAETALNPPLEINGGSTPASQVGSYVGSNVTQPTYEDTTVNIYGQDAPPSLDTMDEASRLMLEQRAEAQGMTTDEYNQEIWRTVREGLGLSTEYTPPAPAPMSQANPEIFSQSEARSPEAASQAVAYFQSSPEAVRIDPSLIQDHTPTTSGNWNFGKLSEPSALVIHHTAGRGGVDGVIQTFKDRNFPAHFVIDRDGTIHRILADDQKGQHTKPAQDGSDISNANSWGVEIIANDDSDLTPKQVEASVQLAYYLHDNYGMPLDRVVGHGQINDHKQETEGATVLAALGALAAGGNPNANMGIPTKSPTSGGGVDNLLAFIAQEEGTGGSYNMVYGGREQPLTDMSIAQVREIGKAAGKYQMMPDTLGDAQRALGLSPDTKFTPEVQEQIVMWLLQRRGLNEWQAGQMTTERFVDNLAMEWAALSTSSGKAHYEGQGANASLPNLLAALGQ